MLPNQNDWLTYFCLFSGTHVFIVYRNYIYKHFGGDFRICALMSFRVSRTNFADRISYVNSFLLYESRFSVPLIVFVFVDFNRNLVIQIPDRG